jgi:hypothetical protein
MVKIARLQEELAREGLDRPADMEMSGARPDQKREAIVPEAPTNATVSVSSPAASKLSRLGI